MNTKSGEENMSAYITKIYSLVKADSPTFKEDLETASEICDEICWPMVLWGGGVRMAQTCLMIFGLCVLSFVAGTFF